MRGGGRAGGMELWTEGGTDGRDADGRSEGEREGREGEVDPGVGSGRHYSKLLR